MSEPTTAAIAEGTGAVLVLDTGGIQDWIIGHAAELRHIRGGSNLVALAFEQLEHDIEAILGPAQAPVDPGRVVKGWWRVVRSSGRLVVVVADVRSAERVRSAAAARIAIDAPGLEVRAGIAEMDIGEEDSFGRALARARSASRTLVPVVLADHDLGADTCEVSGVQTALHGRSGPDAQARRSTMTRRRAEADDAEPRDVDGVRLERQMDRIGEATPSGRFAGYVAVICADGDGIGARFADKRGARELAEESELVHAAVESAERAAYEAAVAAHGSSGLLPVNPVIRAGDDLRFVVPAHVALEFAHGLATGSAEVPISVGALLCHSGLPFATAHEAATELLEVAKLDVRRTAAADPAAPRVPRIAFAVESGSGVRGDLLDRRTTASPFRPSELRALLDARPAVSTGQLRDAVTFLRVGGRVAAREWMLHRLEAAGEGSSGDAYRTVLEHIWRELGCDDPEQPYPASRYRSGTEPDQCSPIGDLLLLAALRSREEDR